MRYSKTVKAARQWQYPINGKFTLKAMLKVNYCHYNDRGTYNPKPNSSNIFFFFNKNRKYSNSYFKTATVAECRTNHGAQCMLKVQ